MPSITLTNTAGSYRVDELVSSIRWSGDMRQCARTLSFEMLADGPDCPVGTAVSLSEGGEAIFSGFVFERSRVSAGGMISLVCYDPGIYLKRTQGSGQYSKVTPEAAVAALCGNYDIKIATLAKTGVNVSRIFLQATLYQMILGLYALASQQTGIPYHIGFDGLGRLRVTEKVQGQSVVLLHPGSNLMDASVSENAGAIINRVAVCDERGATQYSRENTASIAAYGVFQSILKNGENTPKEVESLLKKGEPEQKITVNCLGDVRLTAGQPVMLQEPVTGTTGLFWAESDTHQWRDGRYTTKLVLQFEAVMDAEAAGR